MNRLALLAPALLLAACAAPTVADYDGDSVTIRSVKGAVDPAIFAEAQRVCAVNGRQPQRLGATLQADVAAMDVVFACV